MEDPRLKFLNQASVNGMRVEFSQSPIVLLCGGRVVEKERADDEDLPITSLRHAISIEKTNFELFRPEEITDWQADGVYQNLMDFEEDLAGICSLVVIVLESPGAIAELGAFSQIDDLRHRLMVFTSRDFQDEDSFINLGILRHIKSQTEGSVRDYPWSLPVTNYNDKTPFKVDVQIVKDIIADIGDQINDLSDTAVFKSDNNSHVIALIFQLLSLFIALKRKELREYLKCYNVEISEDELKRKLFLLERFKLIEKGKYSDSTYYKAVSDSFHKIRFPDPGLVDSLRVKVDCNDFYLKNDRHRIGFLKSLKAAKNV